MVAFKTESWVWYGVAMFIIACRTLSRTILLKSIRKLQFDDWLMFVVAATETVFLVTINIAAHTSSNLLAPGEDVSNMSDEERALRIYGSKLVVVVEQMQCLTIWLTKACLLILYYRLTYQLRAHIAVKLLAVYTAVSFVVMEILYLGVWCHPFREYWALPAANVQCTAATNHLIINAVFNLSSDLAMLIVGFSLFIGSHLPWNRKLILCAVFGLGIFVVLCSVFNKYYSFTHPFGVEWTFWYVRESSTAIIVANLPFTWTLIRRVCPSLGAFEPVLPAAPHWQSSQSTAEQCSKEDPVVPFVATLKTPTIHSRRTSRHDSDPPSPRAAQLETASLNRCSWKERGVYGRADIDALSDDPWDLEVSPRQWDRQLSQHDLRPPPIQHNMRRWSNPGYQMKLNVEEERSAEPDDRDTEQVRSESLGRAVEDVKANAAVQHQRYLSV